MAGGTINVISKFPQPTYANGILDYALNVAPVGISIVSLRYMGTSDLPDSNWIYGEAIIIKRSNGAISVTLICDANNYPIATNAYNSNNSDWVGWKFQGSLYIATESQFYSNVLSADSYIPFSFMLGSNVTNAVFSLGSTMCYGIGMLHSSTTFTGIIYCNNEAYTFQLNPSTQTLSSLKRLSNEIQTFSLSSAASHSFTIPNSYRGMMMTHHTTANSCGVWLISASGSGAITKVDVKSASNITLSNTTNKLTMTYNSATTMRYTFINNNGEVAVSS